MKIIYLGPSVPLDTHSGDCNSHGGTGSIGSFCTAEGDEGSDSV